MSYNPLSIDRSRKSKGALVRHYYFLATSLFWQPTVHQPCTFVHSSIPKILLIVGNKTVHISPTGIKQAVVEFTDSARSTSSSFKILVQGEYCCITALQEFLDRDDMPPLAYLRNNRHIAPPRELSRALLDCRLAHSGV
ncbi:hypothetical protein HDU93_002617 [Gonapodya sp. JEL0774]|nr:hypothetical protein HDU93_002617 [Gonapodya sp. JEL0774]